MPDSEILNEIPPEPQHGFEPEVRAETADESRISFATRFKHLGQQLVHQGLWLTLVEGAENTVRLSMGAPTRRFTEITPQLFVGGQYSRRGWQTLKERGITAVVNMRSEYDDERAGLGIEHHLRLPTIDNTPPSLESLHKGVNFIQREIERGGKVYVHCWEGVGRGPTMAAAYLISTGLTVEQAWQTIRRVRPFIRPTEAQVAQIERFASEVAISL
jgi:predicted protein tyrosine phosphatase